jgi:DnaJ-class molecular chaperone
MINNLFKIKGTCPSCHGKGWIEASWNIETCYLCQGKGVIFINKGTK